MMTNYFSNDSVGYYKRIKLHLHPLMPPYMTPIWVPQFPWIPFHPYFLEIGKSGRDIKCDA
jgi:hypothetical protein